MILNGNHEAVSVFWISLEYIGSVLQQMCDAVSVSILSSHQKWRGLQITNSIKLGKRMSQMPHWNLAKLVYAGNSLRLHCILSVVGFSDQSALSRTGVGRSLPSHDQPQQCTGEGFCHYAWDKYIQWTSYCTNIMNYWLNSGKKTSMWQVQNEPLLSNEVTSLSVQLQAKQNSAILNLKFSSFSPFACNSWGTILTIITSEALYVSQIQCLWSIIIPLHARFTIW